MSVKSRIFGLDAARATLLVYGPLIHAIIPGHRTPLIHTIDEGSHLFRMAAFFSVAGFLVALNSRTRQSGWLQDRFRQLFVPLCTMGIILYLFEITIGRTNSDVAMQTREFPFHLWFLIVLIIISPTTIFMDKYKISEKLTRFFEDHHYIFIISIICSAFITQLSLISSEHFHLIPKMPLSWLIKIVLFQTPAYLVFYMLGFFLSRSQVILEKLNKTQVIYVAFFLFTVSLAYFYFILANRTPWTDISIVRMAFHGLSSITQVAMSLAVIFIALRVKRIHPLVSWFSRASYTVYLVHVPFIFALAYIVLKHYPYIGPYNLYATLALSSLILSYLTHYIVSHSDILLFLFNGKRLQISSYFHR